MPRPSRDAEARQLLVEYYSTHGVLPTVEVVAQLMGYRSTSSAHNTIQHLVFSGFLGQTERGGRLVPGPLFRASGPQLPLADPAPELVEAIRELAGDCPVQRVPVADDSLSADGILPGDVLVVTPEVQRGAGLFLLMSAKGRLRLTSKPSAPRGWSLTGAVLAQYRVYR
jgi:SOS-response transcriptional repressor LexA